MSADELIAQLDAIKKDTSLSAEDRKKQLRKLRKQVRKASGHVRAPRESSEVRQAKSRASDLGIPELASRCRSAAQNLELPTYDMFQEGGYGFSLKLALEVGIEDPTIFFKRFEERWKHPPTQFAIHTMPHDTLFLLGPTTGKNDLNAMRRGS